MGERRDLVEARRDEICAIVRWHRGRSEALLGVPVDVVSAGGLKDRDDHIRREAVLL